MPLEGFEALFAQADARAPRVPVAAAGGDDTTVLLALAQAAARGWVLPTVTGPERAVRDAAEAADIDISEFRCVDTTDDPAAVASAAVAEVRSGGAAFLMKGRVATPALLRAVLDPQLGLRSGRTIGQVVLMEIPRDDRRFLLVDTGITVRPTLDQKQALLRSAADLARVLGVPRPRVALVAATESVNPAMPETLEAAKLQELAASGAFPDCAVQGPLSFDLTYAAEAGDRKRIGGEVVGAADVLLFPDLLSANLTVKAIMYTADCRFGGLLCGTTAPVVFMSRADSTETRLRSLALALKVGRGI